MDKDVQQFIKKQKELIYPNKQDIIKEFTNKVKNEMVGTYDQINIAIEEAKQAAVEEYKRLRDEYDKELLNINNEFRQWLFMQYGVQNDRVNEIIYSKAWEDGHSWGYHSIAENFVDLTYFIKQINDVYKSTNLKVRE